jgi:hypothetical protein
MEHPDSVVHRREIGGALVATHRREGRVPEDTPLDQLRHIELPADHAGVVAEAGDSRNGKADARERALDTRLAVHRMGAGHDRSRRLASQHIGSARRLEPVGRNRLPALEFGHGQRTAKAFDMSLHPARERGFVQRIVLRNFRDASIGGFVEGAHEWAAFQSHLIFFASDHLWTSDGPS